MHFIKTHAGVKVKLYPLVNSALDGGKWSDLCSDRFYPTKEPPVPFWKDAVRVSSKLVWRL